jgi:hypothetical protein
MRKFEFCRPSQLNAATMMSRSRAAAIVLTGTAAPSEFAQQAAKAESYV